MVMKPKIHFCLRKEWVDGKIDKMNSLGKIEKVNLRKAWKNEATDFTNWLADDKNMNLLSDEVGIDINLIETETNVGNFNVDIFAEDAGNDRKIIIENQLERTDHDHLGKVITYASGLDAEIIIWIVREAREEHRQAVDWLNNHTDEDLNFFLIRIEVWKIDDSPPAPKFSIVAKPNDWAKAVKRSARETQLTDTKLMQRDFWNKFIEFVSDKEVPYSLEKAKPQHWYSIRIGTSDAKIGLLVNTRENTIGCEFYIHDNDNLFKYLQERSKEIEENIGKKLIWMPLSERKASRVKIEREGILENEDKWDEYMPWLHDMSKRFYKVFRDEISKFE
jgi:hypothetical protein